MEVDDCGMPRMEQLKEKEDEEVSANTVLVVVGDLIKMFTKNKIKTGSEMFILICCS